MLNLNGINCKKLFWTDFNVLFNRIKRQYYKLKKTKKKKNDKIFIEEYDLDISQTRLMKPKLHIVLFFIVFKRRNKLNLLSKIVFMFLNSKTSSVLEPNNIDN